MTTDQIKTAESALDAMESSTDPFGGDDRAANEARQIIAKARYEAFRMVTDARADADAILEEARSEASDLSGIAGANDAVAAENADLVAVNAALRVEYNELVDLINGSQDLLDELNVRLLELATMPDTDTAVALGLVDGSPEQGEVATFAFDYSPSVAPLPKPSKSVSTVRAESFYTRKSAKLPRIGREGGEDALNVVRSMRDRLRDEGSS